MLLEEPIADLLLERFRLGELPEAQRQAVERRLAEDAEARARLERLAESDREVLSTYPPERLVGSIRRRAEHAQAVPSRSRSPLLFAVPAFAAAALLLVLAQPPMTTGVPGEQVGGLEDTRIKGMKPHLLAYRVSGRSAEFLPDGAATRAGNTLQLQYVGAGRRYGVVVSIDGRGQVTLHLPVSPGEASPLNLRGEVPLPRAYQLDDAPGFERFFFVTSDSPFATGQVLEASRALAAKPDAARDFLALPAGLDQSTLLLRKVEP